VAELLGKRRIRFAVIGAAAMAVHGVSRSTRDLDILIVTSEALDPMTWTPLTRQGIAVEVRRGSLDDPLAGVVRITEADALAIDVVVGKGAWQARIVLRATEATIDGERVPVARLADLILLKLYAGGAQDAWDVQQLLEAGDRIALIAEIDGTLPELPPEARRLWERMRER
jgi:predicted nucleotidyltransferase